MENKENKQSDDRTGTAFTESQSAKDTAKNERIKSETKSEKLPPEVANDPNKRNLKTDVSLKKTGGGKQSSPGD
jgi:hypothetical protein